MAGTSSYNWNAHIIGTDNGSAFTGWTAYATKMVIRTPNGGADLWAQFRYVTSSGQDYWIWLLLNKNTNKIIASSSAADHPSYGNGGDPELIPHPFNSYDSSKHKIILLDKESCDMIRQESKLTGKSILTLVHNEYRPNFIKTEKYKPLHSGRFIDKVPVLIETIQSYVKVRKLIELTSQEIVDRENYKKSLRDEYDQKIQLKKVKRDSAKNKLKNLGLTDEELTLLFEQETLGVI